MDELYPAKAGLADRYRPQSPLANKMKTLLVSLALVTPLAAMADEGTCTKLIPDIMANYRVENLELRNGNPPASQVIVVCAYTATTPDLYGDRHVIVLATLNRANHRFTVEIN